jgi:hypothetical protein
MHLALFCGSGGAGKLDGRPEHAAEIGMAISHCAAVGGGSRDDVDRARARPEQAVGVAVAGALPYARDRWGLQRDATRPGRKRPLGREDIFLSAGDITSAQLFYARVL